MAHNVRIDLFESIGPEYRLILKKKFHVETVDKFLIELNEGKLKELKPTLEAEHLDATVVDDWIQIFDLFRIPLLSPRDAEILQVIGINSVEELSYLDSYQILEKIRQLEIDSYYIILNLPTFTQLDNWIFYANLITRKIKIEAAVPLINFFPIVSLANAGEFQKYRIWTAEDLEASLLDFPMLREDVGMGNKEWNKLLTLVDFVRIKGMTLTMAKLLEEKKIKSLSHLKSIKPQELLQRVSKLV